MRIDEPILTSFLDDDLYKITTGAVVFSQFPRVKVKYEFFNRGKTPFPFGFEEELERQINLMQFLKMTEKERDFLADALPSIPPTYLEWLFNYRLDPREVEVKWTMDKALTIRIEGYWYRTIFWEVKLMAVISELYFRLTKQQAKHDWEKRIIRKANNLEKHNAPYVEFGTRRRFSFETQDRVVDVMRDFDTFKGTSNPYLAMKYGVPVKGTFPHEAIMAMSARYGATNANQMWLHSWQSFYKDQLLIALPDTFTTDVFLKTFQRYQADTWQGLRQDSGNPYTFMDDKVVPFYASRGIDLKKKTIMFSDKLDDKSYILLHKRYNKKTNVLAGIGTFLTNDVGVTPLNMVIKMTEADFCENGEGPKYVVKLSDDSGKYTGDPDAIKSVKKELGI